MHIQGNRTKVKFYKKGLYEITNYYVCFYSTTVQ